MNRFVNANPDQPLLLPVDLREWVPADDLVHFVREAAERVPMSHFKLNDRGSGSAQYPPQMMLTLLIYCYAHGVFGSRRIEAATYRDVAVRYLTGDTHPDHDTICKFRRDNQAGLAEAFLQVLELARELKLLKVGMVSVDGTKVDANASRYRSVRHDRAQALREQLQRDIDGLLAAAEHADRQSAGGDDKLPESLARRERLKAKLDEACARLERQAKARAQRERAEQAAKRAARPPGKRGGRPPKAPTETPEPDQQTNLTDSDSALMRRSRQHEYRQAYNAQLTVDADGSYLIVGQRVTNAASDQGQLIADLEAIPPSLGPPQCVLADNSYLNEDDVSTLQQREIEALIATGTEGQRRRYDFRPPSSKSPREPRADWIRAMSAKLQS